MKTRVLKKLLAALLCSACVIAWAGPAPAEPDKKVDFVTAGPLWPEFAEAFGLNMYVSALKGRMALAPPLKGFSLKVTDKGMMYGSQDDALTGVSTGAVEMTYSGPHFLEQLHPAWKLGEAPGVFDSWAHFERAMKTPVWQELHEKMAEEKGVTILKWVCHPGDWFLFTDKGPVQSMADLKDQKIRIAGGEAFSRAVKAMGATPVSLPYTEVVTSLQTNMIDGVLTDMNAGTYYYKLPRYTQYLVPVSFTVQPICVVVNTDWYQSLDPKARKAFTDVFERINVQDFYSGMQQHLVQHWRDKAELKVMDLSREERDRWRQTMFETSKKTLADIPEKYLEAINETR